MGWGGTCSSYIEGPGHYIILLHLLSPLGYLKSPAYAVNLFTPGYLHYTYALQKDKVMC